MLAKNVRNVRQRFILKLGRLFPETTKNIVVLKKKVEL